MIDVTTLLAFLAASELALAAVVMASSAGARRAGGLAWSASLAVRALAAAIFAARIEPHGAALAVGAGLLSLSLTLQAAALLAFAGRRLPAWVHSSLIAAVAVPCALLAENPAAMLTFGALVFAIAFAALGAFAWHAARGYRARSPLCACFATAAGVFLARGVAAVFSSDPLFVLVQPSGAQSAMLLAAAVALLTSSFAFLLLHNEQSDGEARRLATLDPLTGAYNRHTFHEIAEREMARVLRAGQPLSIVMLDLDHFRAVNESHGQRAGDELLKEVAEALRSALRREDMLVRFGGEEFLVLLPDVPGPGAVVVAGRLRKAVEARAFALESERIAMTVSVGVAARLDEGPESVDSLVARADEALALAKRRGRNRVVALSLGRSIAA